MLIKIIRSWKDDGEKHVDHITRRSFLGQSVKLGAAYMALPTLHHLFLSDPALAAVACQAAQANLSAAGIAHYDAAGGNGGTMIFAPIDTGGSVIDMTAGTRAMGRYTSQSSTILKGVSLNAADTFALMMMNPNTAAVDPTLQNQFPGLTQAMWDTIRSKMTVSLVMTSNQDDNSNNQLSPAPAILRIVSGQTLKGIGAARSRTIDGAFGGFTTVNAGNVTGLVNAVGAANGTLNKPAYGTRIANAVTSLNELQRPGLMKHIDGEALIDKVNCAIGLTPPSYDSNLALSRLDPATAHAANYAGLLNIRAPGSTAVVGTPSLDPNAARYFRLAAYNAVVSQQAGIVSFADGGYDYHNGQAASLLNSQNQTSHGRIAIEVITAMIAAHAQQRPMLFAYTTDGGINWDSSGASPVARGDRGSVNICAMIMYHPTANLTARHVGRVNMVNQSETALRTGLAGSNPKSVAAAIALTWAELTGVQGIKDQARADVQKTIGATDVSSLIGVSVA